MQVNKVDNEIIIKLNSWEVDHIVRDGYRPSIQKAMNKSVTLGELISKVDNAGGEFVNKFMVGREVY